jgi:hypothetical protein
MTAEQLQLQSNIVEARTALGAMRGGLTTLLQIVNAWRRGLRPAQDELTSVAGGLARGAQTIDKILATVDLCEITIATSPTAISNVVETDDLDLDAALAGVQFELSAVQIAVIRATQETPPTPAEWREVRDTVDHAIQKIAAFRSPQPTVTIQ